MRRQTVIAVAVAVLLFNVGWGRKKPSYDLDKSRLGAVKKVAIFTVYGPTHHAEGSRAKVDLKPFLDSAETAIVHGLTINGFEVVPLERVKAAFQKSYAEVFAEALASTSRRERDRERIRELVRASGLQHRDTSILGLATASRNTSFVYGTDEPGWLWELYYTVDDDPRIVEQGEPYKAEHMKAAISALGRITQSLGADAFLIVRLRPTTATVKNEVGNNRSFGQRLNPLNAVRDSVKTLKTGEWGASILEMDLYEPAGSLIYSEQVITRSKEEIGNVATGFKVKQGIGVEAATALMKEAQDASIRTAFMHLTGKALPDTAPGLGLEAIAEQAAASEAAKQARDAAAPARAASVAGVYGLTSVMGKPLPYKNSQGLVYDKGSLELRPDGTFSAITYFSGKKSEYKGTYTIDGNNVQFKAEGGMLVKLTAPTKGTIENRTITVYPNEMVYTQP